MTDLRTKYLSLIAEAQDAAVLEDLRVQAVGKKGEISLQMRELGKMTPEQRQEAGPMLNALKNEINSALAAKKEALEDAVLNERLRTEWLDVTLPSRGRPAGTLHPISQVWEEVTAIFADMGFSVAEGPQIESDWYNFDALNIPGHHPARAEMDTFYTHRAEGDDRPPHRSYLPRIRGQSGLISPSEADTSKTSRRPVAAFFFAIRGERREIKARLTPPR